MDHVRLSDFNCIPEFHGYRQDVGMPALQWLQRFEKLATMVQWTEPQWLTVASLRMVESAALWISAFNPTTWAEFRQAFTKRYGDDSDMVLSKLLACSQGTDTVWGYTSE